jgi:hypothetical protein
MASYRSGSWLITVVTAASSRGGMFFPVVEVTPARGGRPILQRQLDLSASRSQVRALEDGLRWAAARYPVAGA